MMVNLLLMFLGKLSYLNDFDLFYTALGEPVHRACNPTSYYSAATHPMRFLLQQRER